MLQYLQNVSKIHIILLIIAIIIGVYYQQFTISFLEYKSEHSSGQSPATGEGRIFSKAELSKYNEDNLLYLAILGSVYDVTKGVKHYGKSCAYHYFVGRDASVSFVTGEFEKFIEEEADDVLKLKNEDFLSLKNWKNFYDKEYTYKGKLIGRFYDETGALTKYHMKFNQLVELAEKQKKSKDDLRIRYPDCNIEWKKETGTRVWCTTSSGGKERDWQGYPRKLFEVGSEKFRCACVKEDDLNTKAVMLKTYDNCDDLSNECFYHVD